MKRKNPYITLTIVGALITIILIMVTVTIFLNKNFIVGTFLLILSCVTAFSNGMILKVAVEVHNHNKACEFLEDISKFLHEQIAEQIEPFEELNKGENNGQCKQ